MITINFADEYIKLEDSTDNLRKQITEYSKRDSKLSAALDERNAKVKELESEIQALKIEIAKLGGIKNGGNNKHR